MLPILVAQLLLPVALLAWLAAVRPRSRTAFVVSLLATLLLFWGIARVGVWVFPPWWTPWAGMAVALMTAAWRVVRGLPDRTVPTGAREWIGVAVIACGGAFGAFVVLRAEQGRRMPPIEPVELAFPLAWDSSRVLVVNGGSWEVINAHRASARSTDPRFVPWRGNGWAVDLVAIDRWGRRSHGIQPADPSAYRIFGEPVYAPCAGEVVIATDGRPDMRVPEYDRPLIAGNHVILACGNAHVVVAHLANGSVTVRTGEHVAVGTQLGAVGNSGGTDEPHLHIHAQRPGPSGLPMGGEPLPITFGGRFLVRGDRLP
jgi:hypothetical protein